MMRTVDLEQLTSAESVLDRIGASVGTLTLIRLTESGEWRSSLFEPPDGWKVGHVGGDPQLSRIAVTGPRSDGGWDGCETLSIFGFTGSGPAATEVVQHNDATLQSLAADSTTTYVLDTALSTDVIAVRSSGYISSTGRRLWAQTSTFVRAGYSQTQGVLMCQTLVIEARYRGPWRDDIADLSDAVHLAFVSQAGTVAE